MRAIPSRLLMAVVAICLLYAMPASARDVVQLGGQLKKWHPVTLTLDGPETAEQAESNPFRNYRFNVVFSHDETGKTYVVPGYFASDGDAANTSAPSGNKWRAVFIPSETGAWSYMTSFREGADVAVSTDPDAGRANACDGLAGSFTVEQTDKSAPDVRAHRFLQYDGTRYVGVGPDSPETFLEYRGFDGTINISGTDYVRDWDAHVRDWQAGDATWEGGSVGATKGKG